MNRVKQNFHNFDVHSVALEGRNLIEASAGTGKTYSIAILVLRLILENKIGIHSILMVTFTKAAVAELEERIRLFVRNAYKVAEEGASADPTITAIVTDAVARDGREEVIQLLKEAKLLLDETAVMTIHSFCQATLNEFALETKQLFGSDMLQDLSAIRQQQVDIFWRKNITTLHPLLLKSLADIDFSRQHISKIIDNTLGGQRFLFYNPAQVYQVPEEVEQLFLQQLDQLDKQRQEKWEELISEFNPQKETVIQKCESNRHAQKSLLPLTDDAESFFTMLNQLTEKAYAIKLFGDWIEKLTTVNAIREQSQLVTEKLANHILSAAIQQITSGIQRYKDDNGLLSFDDLIRKLNTAIKAEGSSKLNEKLREKYQAVFIDEFQDTDRLQYEIFDRAFGDGTIVFYIGDPKQSIYAWRQADINTYFKAGREVDNRYSMNINYRSSHALIDSMNLFFLPNADFDTFHFQREDDEISYIPVEASSAKREFSFISNKQQQPGITVFNCSNKDEIAESVAKQVLLLLTDQGNKLKYKDVERNIRPSDIGILIRSNREGEAIKKELSKLGVPAITIDTNKVLMTSEARYVYYILRAIFDINKHTISRAILSPFTDFTTKDLQTVDLDKLLIEFGILKQMWESSGVYVALNKFIDDFQVREVLLNKNDRRALTNLLQIIEILHKTQNLRNLSALELMNWLKIAGEGLPMEGDEYEQRIEGDQEAVEIVTIHKSKGLEYHVVLAPFLDLKSELKKSNRSDGISFESFRSQDEYLFAPAEKLDEDQKSDVLLQKEQENRRLIYVAVTRAVYKCYIFKNNSNASKTSSLSYFVDAIHNLPEGDIHPYIDFADSPELDNNRRYTTEKTTQLDEHSITRAQNFSLKQRNWTKMSYTYLAKKPEYIFRDNRATDLVDYDHFVFKQLIRGSLAGNFLHHLFENIDFSREETWEPQVQASLSRYLPKQLDIAPMINELIRHVVSAKLKLGEVHFRLREVSRSKRLNELEFNFNVAAFQVWHLNQLSTAHAPFAIRSFEEMEGLMTGKIDMIFQHQDSYYILDWKSNYLGDSLVYYGDKELDQAMTQNNYHLQYLIYTLALKKYLQQRLVDFDYERNFGGVIYVFARGARADEDSGMYITKPPIEQIVKLESLLSAGHV